MQLNFLEYYACSKLAYHEGPPGVDISTARDGNRLGVYATMIDKDLYINVLGVNNDKLTDVRELAHYFNPEEGELIVRDIGLNYTAVRTIEAPEGEHVKLQFMNAIVDLHATPGRGVFVSDVQELDYDDDYDDDGDDAPTSNFT